MIAKKSRNVKGAIDGGSVYNIIAPIIPLDRTPNFFYPSISHPGLFSNQALSFWGIHGKEFPEVLAPKALGGLHP
jgi:hypothetical protein